MKFGNDFTSFLRKILRDFWKLFTKFLERSLRVFTKALRKLEDLTRPSMVARVGGGPAGLWWWWWVSSVGESGLTRPAWEREFLRPFTSSATLHKTWPNIKCCGQSHATLF